MPPLPLQGTWQLPAAARGSGCTTAGHSIVWQHQSPPVLPLSWLLFNQLPSQQDEFEKDDFLVEDDEGALY